MSVQSIAHRLGHQVANSSCGGRGTLRGCVESSRALRPAVECLRFTVV